MMRLMMIGTLAAAMLMLAGCPSGGGGSASWGTAADFKYTSFSGSPGKLSDHAGKVTVVNFWAVW